MAINIYLSSMSTKVVTIGEYEDVEVVRLCIRDYQKVMNLIEGDKVNHCSEKVRGKDMVDRYISECATLCCSFPVDIPEGHSKRSIIFNRLWEAMDETSTEVRPQDTPFVHYIENPLLTGLPLRFGNWKFEKGGIHYLAGEGTFIPTLWLLVMPTSKVMDYLGKFLISERVEGIKDPMSLLSASLDATLELNSQCTKDRSDEVRRKFDTLAKLIRTIMEESDKNSA